MTWIKALLQRWQTLLAGFRLAHQAQLMLLLCLPCLLVAIISLISTDASAYLIAFIVVCLALLCCYAIVANKKYADYQVRTLANLIESMIDGDYSLRGRLKSNQAFQELLILINNLSDTLAQHKLAVKESRVLLELIVDQMDAMVLATDANGNLVMANNSAQQLLLNGAEKFEGIALNSFVLGAQLAQAFPGIIDFKHQPRTINSKQAAEQPALEGEYFLYKEKFFSAGQSHQLYLLTNAERLLMEKERNAWQSLLRVLSHEINNSLTPISTISQSIEKKLLSNLDNKRTIEPESLLDGINIINERADTLSEFIASYSQLAHLPKPLFSTFNLYDMLNKLTLLFPQCEFTIDKSIDIQLTVDKKQLEQVFINLFKNAIDAMSSFEQKLIVITYRQDSQWQQIMITDCGSGVANVENLFVPFYTTKPNGSGIGLALCRQIMFGHNGQIKLTNNINKPGIEVRLSLPN